MLHTILDRAGSPPFSETSPIGQGILNPYGQTKYMAEVRFRSCLGESRNLTRHTSDARSSSSPASCCSHFLEHTLHLQVILHDFQAAHPTFAVMALRYFNPVGAHPSGELDAKRMAWDVARLLLCCVILSPCCPLLWWRYGVAQ